MVSASKSDINCGLNNETRFLVLQPSVTDRGRRRLLVQLWLLAMAIVLGLSESATAQIPTAVGYSYTQLAVPNGCCTNPQGINDRGQIVGAYFQTARLGFIYDNGHFDSPSNPFPGANWTAFKGINNRGQIVGFIEVFHSSAPSEFHGILLDRSSLTWTFFDFPGAVQTLASGINDWGQIVGVYSDGTRSRGFILDRGVFSSFDVPFPGAQGIATVAINNKGQIVGTYVDSANFNQGFLLDRGVFSDLNLPHPGGIHNGTFASAINDRGQIVGCLDTGAFLIDHGVLASLDVPAFANGGTCAGGINNRGEISGNIGAGSNGGTGFIATPVH